MDKRIQKTQALIKSNLIKLLQEKDISRITVKELTEKCNISRKTFYLHYQTIYFAVDDIENDIMKIVNELFDRLYDTERQTDFDSVSQMLNTYITENETLIDFLANYKNSESIKSKIKAAALNAMQSRKSDKINGEENYIFQFLIGGIYDLLIYYHNDSSISANNFSRLCIELIKSCWQLL